MFNSPFQKLMNVYEKTLPEDFVDESVPRIRVNKVVARLASIYEKVRNMVEYREEHLLRKNAIERIIKRRLFYGEPAQDLAKPLILELIRAGYLSDNMVPETKIEEVKKVLSKYHLLILKIYQEKKERDLRKFVNWLVSLAACEIDEVLVSTIRRDALIECMFQVMKQRLSFKEALSSNEKDIQIYIAIHRSLLKSDQEIIQFSLLKLFYPEWEKDEISEETIEEIFKKLPQIKESLESYIKNPLQDRLRRIFRRNTIYFLILEDILKENAYSARDIFTDREELASYIKNACEARYKKARIRLGRMGVRSIIYIFLTKMLLALLIEIPFDLYFKGVLDWLALGVNVTFHPIFLFLIILTIKIPSEKNTEKITSGIERIVYAAEEKIEYIIGKPSSGRSVFDIIFYVIYLIFFVLSFGLIIYGLSYLNFSALSVAIFILFLCLVSFFGLRIRFSSRELVVVGKEESVLSHLTDLFFVPIIRAGRWLSENFAKINVFVFILDFLIEAPFKFFIEIIEDWFAFLKEKKEEIL